MFRAILTSEQHLARAMTTLVENCVAGITVNTEHCRQEVERSSIAATILSPILGYEKTTQIIKKAMATKQSVRELVKQEHVLSDSLIDDLFSPEVLTNVRKANQNQLRTASTHH